MTLNPRTSAIPFDRHGPTDVGVGDDGRVWVVNGLDRSVSVLTPKQSQPTLHIRLPQDVGVLGVGVAHIAVTPTAIWVDNGGAAGVSRLDPTSGKALGRATQGVPTGAIAAGAGAIWVGAAANYFGSGTVAQLNSATGQDVAVFNVGEVDGLTAGFGYAWVADAADGTVERLDRATDTNPTTPAPGRVSARIPVGKGVQSITTGDGMVWAANPLTRTIDEISPATRKVVRQIAIGGQPSSIVESDGRLWVTIAPSAPAVRAGGVRVAISPADIDTVDPAATASAIMWQIDYAAGLHLVRLQDANGPAGRRIVPDAARSWRISNHGRTYTFTIRRGLEFSPPWNQPVTAETFRYSFERDIEVDSQLGSFLGVGLRGAAPFLANHATHISGIRAHGYTLSITWTSQKGLLDFLSLLALPYASAVPIGWTGPGPAGDVPSAGPNYIRSYIPDSRLCTQPKPALSRAPSRTHLRIHIR